MTDRRTRAPRPPNISARTTEGHGTSLVLAKTHSHLMLVLSALLNEWPISAEQISEELRDAKRHLDNLTWPQAVMTDGTTQQKDDFITAMHELTSDLGALSANIPDDFKTTLQTVIRSSWQLLCRLDLELTGVHPTLIEPGSAP